MSTHTYIWTHTLEFFSLYSASQQNEHSLCKAYTKAAKLFEKATEHEKGDMNEEGHP